MTGIWLNWPVVQAVIGVTGMTEPSTIGPVTYGPLAFAVPLSCRIWGADSARRHAAAVASSPGQLAAVAKFVPRVSPIERGCNEDNGELSKIARWNKPLLNGEIMLAPVSVAPADWPPRVTRFG